MAVHSTDLTLRQFRTEIRRLQLSARSLRDIANGVSQIPDLLRKTSETLGHRVEKAFYDQAAAVYTFKLEETPWFMHGPKDRNYLDKYMRHWQVCSDVTFHTDETISLCTVMNNIREFGVTYDNTRNPEWPGERNEMLLYFSPARWPYVASDLLVNMYKQDSKMHGKIDQYAQKLISEAYADSDFDILKAMFNSGLFDDPLILCDWLVTNESKSRPEDLRTGLTLPIDLQD